MLVILLTLTAPSITCQVRFLPLIVAGPLGTSFSFIFPVCCEDLNLFLWLNRGIYTFTPNHLFLFLKKTKKKKIQRTVILYQRHLKNQFSSGLRARAQRKLSPYWNSNKLFCHPLEVAWWGEKKRLCYDNLQKVKWRKCRHSDRKCNLYNMGCE